MSNLVYHNKRTQQQIFEGRFLFNAPEHEDHSAAIHELPVTPPHLQHGPSFPFLRGVTKFALQQIDSTVAVGRTAWCNTKNTFSKATGWLTGGLSRMWNNVKHMEPVKLLGNTAITAVSAVAAPLYVAASLGVATPIEIATGYTAETVNNVGENLVNKSLGDASHYTRAGIDKAFSYITPSSGGSAGGHGHAAPAHH